MIPRHLSDAHNLINWLDGTPLTFHNKGTGIAWGDLHLSLIMHSLACHKLVFSIYYPWNSSVHFYRLRTPIVNSQKNAALISPASGSTDRDLFRIIQLFISVLYSFKLFLSNIIALIHEPFETQYETYIWVTIFF